MTLDTKAARERCEKATAGPWRCSCIPNCEGDDPLFIINEVSAHREADRRDGDESDVLDDEGWCESVGSLDANFIAHARTLLPLALDEIDRLRAELADEERSHGETIDERDHFANRIDEIADALGDDTEWSNANDRGANALELARAASKDLARLRADLNNIYSTAAEPVIRIMAEDALK